jgi:hypothetical protein
MYKKFISNPWLIFSPFLFYYSYIIVLNKWPKLYGDEIRYVDFAHNLIHGFYSPPAPHINLWNGPGYPIILAPFIALHIPVIYITLFNAVYLYMAIVFLFQALSLIANKKAAIVFSLLLAIYPNAQSMLPILYTEAFTDLLISAFIYAVALCYIKGKPKHWIIAGFVLGYLTLTKIIFGYVLIFSLVISLVFILSKKRKTHHLVLIKILLVALAVTSPYLVYTYNLTGKAFYWGNSGGMSLYWMSSPYEYEYGDWKVPDLSNNQYPTLFKSAAVNAILKNNHKKDIDFIIRHDEIEQDVLFKKIAISNIKNHPLKFAKNYYYNFSRMLFNFPYSYAYQDGAIIRNILTGSLILWGSAIGIVLTFINWRNIIYPVKFVLLITGVYLLLSGALSAYPRQLDVMVPAFIFWIAYLITNTKKISLKFTGKQNIDTIDLLELGGIEEYAEESVEEKKY